MSNVSNKISFTKDEFDCIKLYKRESIARVIDYWFDTPKASVFFKILLSSYFKNRAQCKKMEDAQFISASNFLTPEMTVRELYKCRDMFEALGFIRLYDASGKVWVEADELMAIATIASVVNPDMIQENKNIMSPIDSMFIRRNLWEIKESLKNPS